MSATLDDLEKQRDKIREKLSSIGDMRQGSLVERYRKCGKAACRCATDDSLSHGPCWSLTRGIKGKTLTRVIPAAAVEETKAQLAQGQEFRKTSQELYEVNEKICEAKLSGSVNSKDIGKKKSSARRSRQKSLQR